MRDTDNTCLNCNTTVSGKFCNNCGQKTDTHRINLKHFLFHDILHGVWHMEKGIFFTIKEAILRPGFAANDYIAGKRVKYYNVFSLILLILGVYLFVNHYYNYFMLKIRGVSNELVGHNSAAYEFATKYEKPLLLLLIPMMAICSYFVFNKRKLNFAEHLIISGFVFIGYLLICLFGAILLYFNIFEQNFVENLLSNIETAITILYVIFCYYQLTFGDYSKLKFGLRMFLFSLCFVLQVAFIFILILICNIKK